MNKPSRAALAPALAFAVAAAAAPGSDAATYYVDRGHASASDANSGSESAPWATIAHAVSAASPVSSGDTVYVKAGDYSEQVVVALSGSPGSVVTLAAYPGDTVTVDGSSVALPDWSGLVHLEQVSHVTLSGFRVVSARASASSLGIAVSGSDHITIQGNYVYDTSSSGIIVWGSANVVVDGNEVELASNGGADSQNECLTVGETTGFQVSNNHVHHGGTVRGEGIDVKDGSTSGLVFGNHVHDVMFVGIYVDAWDKPTSDIDVFGNLVHDIEGDAYAIGSEQGGLLQNVRVYNNIGYGCRQLGITVHNCCEEPTPVGQHPLSEILIVNNTFYANGEGDWGGGILHENTSTSGLVIRNNIVSENLSFQIAIEGPDPASVTIDHNLVHGFRGYPGELYGSAHQEGDPLFVSTANPDFRLQGGSPAIDNGSSVDVPSQDYAGTPRPQGSAPDMGAFEHTGAALSGALGELGVGGAATVSRSSSPGPCRPGGAPRR